MVLAGDEFSAPSLLRLAVLPAVESVLNGGEVDLLSVGHEVPPGVMDHEERPDRYWLYIKAVGEPFYLSLDAEPLGTVGWEAMRQHIANELSTFVAESAFGWGQQR